MTKIFYDHLIIFEEAIALVDNHALTPDERSKILTQIDELFQNKILDVILTHLPKKHHEKFLHEFAHTPGNTNLMKFLQEHTDVDIEKKILYEANSVKKLVQRLIETTHAEGLKK